MTGAGTSRLIKDLASLFVKYKLSDWEPLLRELRGGSAVHDELARAIEKTLATASSSPKPRAKAKESLKRSSRYQVSSTRSRILGPLQEGLQSRRVLPSINALREAARQVGAKPSDTTKRNELISELIMHLDQVPNERLWSLMQVITKFKPSSRENLEEDYFRWCSVILGRGKATSSPFQKSKSDL